MVAWIRIPRKGGGSSEIQRIKQQWSAWVSSSHCLACRFDSGHPKRRPYQCRWQNPVPKEVPTLIDFPGTIADMFFHDISFAFGRTEQVSYLLIISFLITLWCPHFEVLHIGHWLQPSVWGYPYIPAWSQSQILSYAYFANWDVLRMTTRTIVMSDIDSQICLGSLSLFKANRVIQ